MNLIHLSVNKLPITASGIETQGKQPLLSKPLTIPAAGSGATGPAVILASSRRLALLLIRCV